MTVECKRAMYKITFNNNIILYILQNGDKELIANFNFKTFYTIVVYIYMQVHTVIVDRRRE